MFFEFVTLLILVLVVVSYIRLVRRIRDSELTLSAEKTEIVMMVERNIATTSSVLTLMQRVVDYQKVSDELMDALSDKMNALAKLVDEHSSSVTFSQNQLDTLMRADVLAARREELLRTKELKTALERLMGVAMTSRQAPSPNDVLALENLDNRIDELEKILAE